MRVANTDNSENMKATAAGSPLARGRNYEKLMCIWPINTTAATERTAESRYGSVIANGMAQCWRLPASCSAFWPEPKSLS